MGASKSSFMEERERQTHSIEHGDLVYHKLLGQGVVVDMLPPDNIAVRFDKFGDRVVKAKQLLTSYQEIKGHL